MEEIVVEYIVKGIAWLGRWFWGVFLATTLLGFAIGEFVLPDKELRLYFRWNFVFLGFICGLLTRFFFASSDDDASPKRPIKQRLGFWGVFLAFLALGILIGILVPSKRAAGETFAGSFALVGFACGLVWRFGFAPPATAAPFEQHSTPAQQGWFHRVLMGLFSSAEITDAIKEVRTGVLTMTASKAGFQPSEQFPKVFAIVMDTPDSGGGASTVIAMCDGNASLLSQSMIGSQLGAGPPSPRLAAATDFVTAAQACYDAAKPATEYPYPPSGCVCFYLLGFAGVRVVAVTISTAAKPDGPYSAMWTAGQRVRAELRTAAGKT